MNRSWFLLGGLFAAVGLVHAGCGPTPVPVASNNSAPTPSATPTIMPGPPALPSPPALPGPPVLVPMPPTEAQIPGPPPSDAPPDAPTEATPPAIPLTVPDPPATPTETVKADVGVGIKGRSLDEHEGILVTPAKAYFAIREKAIFQIAIPQAIQLYKATDGNAPQTHEEFMQKIIADNKIKLPQLPPGHTYEWNPETEELMVKRPKK